MNIFGIFIEGGQTWAHRMRMLRQVFKLAMALSLFASLCIFCLLMFKVQFSIYQASYYHLKANSIGLFTQNIEVDSHLWETLSNERHPKTYTTVHAKKVSARTEPHFSYFLYQTQENLKKAGEVSSVALGIIMLFFILRGAAAKGKKHVSGRQLASSWRVALRLTLTGRASPIRLGIVPLLKGSETQHIMLTGGTGSGKTNCLHHLLPQIRSAGQKAIIVDTTGAFVQRYFREGKDILLSPFDKRSAAWHPWAECETQFDVDDLCEGFIPTSYSEHDSYWRNASRAVFAALLQKNAISKKTSELTRWILFEPLAALCTILKGTRGAAHIDPNSEKTAASIRSVMASFLSCLELLPDTGTPFAIRDWIRREDDDSWLFLACTPGQRASIRPLLSCWFSIATKALFQLQPNLNRRLWFVVDELPSLNRLKDLEVFLAEARKYGGCALMALQSLAQLEAIYGRDITKTIIGNCATKIAFSEQSHEIAEKISRAFGQHEIKEYQEGMSYGAHETRDSVSLSQHTKNRPLVSVTDIQTLKRNQAFIQLPENIPITKIKLPLAPQTSTISKKTL